MKRKLILSMLLSLSTACCATGARAQMGGGPMIAPGTQVAPADALNALLENPEKSMMNLVKAMPADKYSFAPSQAIFVPSQKTEYTGVRTFAALCIHVAQANYGLGGRIAGLKPDIDPMSLTKLTDKDQIVAALQASFDFVHKSIATVTTANAFESVRGPMTRATMAAFVAVHTSDEYGQMVEYLRMNGLVPPASQK
jgi:DinB superfamily